MKKCTVYDKAGRELQPALSTDALIWEMEGNAVILEYHDGITYRTVKREYQLPLTIVLKHVVKMSTKPDRRAPLTNLNLFVRDAFTCQYCGRHESKLQAHEVLNRDHIIPRDASGENNWENCTTSCSTCNSTKSNRTPEQAGMRLRSKPTVPTLGQVRQWIKKYAKQRK